MAAMRARVVVTVIVFLGLSAEAYRGPQMGVANDCDDAKTHLEVDWIQQDFTPFTCKVSLPYAAQDVDPVYYEIPNFNARTDVVYHKCMNESIAYRDEPPLRGDHRPNWAKWGEYLYLPVQRWLHNLEHGSIVLLYHPCVDEHELSKLRQIVTSCLYRHIITPYIKLTERYPLALVAWGAKLQMNKVDEEQAVQFIRKHAHVAPEDLSRQGMYDLHLIQPSRIVSDIDDKNVCPNYYGGVKP